MDSFTIHPEYQDDNGPNNIAMAKTSSPFNLNQFVMPILLPPPGLTQIPIYQSAIIAGWGMTSVITGAYSMRLLKGSVPIHSRFTCEIAWGPTVFTETDICAGVLKGTPTSCAGDSG